MSDADLSDMGPPVLSQQEDNGEAIAEEMPEQNMVLNGSEKCVEEAASVYVEAELTPQQPGEEQQKQKCVAVTVNPQIVIDPHGNCVTVHVDDLAAAGFDVNNLSELTEEQVARLLEVAQHIEPMQRSEEQAAGEQAAQGEEGTAEDAQFEKDVGEMGALEEHHFHHNPPPTNVGHGQLTMIIADDGSLKLSDADDRQFYISSAQLSAARIDVNNLDDDAIQHIVQMALPTINASRQAQGEKRRKLEPVSIRGPAPGMGDRAMDMAGQAGGGGHRVYDRGDGYMHDGGGGGIPAVPSTSTTYANAFKAYPSPADSSLVGESVEVRRQGKLLSATIRYVRAGMGYKVQFDDGHFEWLNEDQMMFRGQRRTDHGGYSGGDEMRGQPQQRAPQQGGAMPVLKRVASEMAGAGGGGGGGGGPIPGIKVSGGAHQHSHQHGDDRAPNFCCPVCDRKVYQKEPAYIVIRVPACDSCTRQKIMILEDPVDRQQPQ